MNESDTRLQKIDPALKAAGWSVVAESRILTEVQFTNGRISRTVKPKPLKADYILVYRGVKLAVVEAKSDERDVADGVGQAKVYAKALDIRFTYATNGNTIYEMDMATGAEQTVAAFPSPEALWQRTFSTQNTWRDTFNACPLYSGGGRKPRYYQEIAIRRTLDAIADGRKRMLLTLATGTGKTFIAFQIAWKLFQSRWNVRQTGTRPRILFLADRNTLANQAFNGFDGFSADAKVRISAKGVKKTGEVPRNGSIFFTIFQTFMSETDGAANFGQYPPDFFDLIIIDECHRGGANDESSWREILQYFNSAVQLGLTATPRRDCNADTYRYFGDPLYEYSLRRGIEDGFLTPFHHVKMSSNIDEYQYTPDDEVVSGEVDEGRVYTETDFYHGNIKIRQRDELRVREWMNMIDRNEKTLVFCCTQNHAGQVRDMINSINGGNPFYAVRVTANDGALGEQYLKEFQDNEKTIPTILTTSEKLSTGVDALNVRNIVLMRPVNSMVEYKQIVGRGTRLYDGKYFFSIYDFVKAYAHYADPQWDGEPVCSRCGNSPCTCTPSGSGKRYVCRKCGHNPCICVCEKCGQNPCVCPCPKCGSYPCICEKDVKEPVEIYLGKNHVRRVKFVRDDMFWGKDGKLVSTQEFVNEMFGDLPSFFTSIDDLKQKWAYPESRAELLVKMGGAGYGMDVLEQLRSLIGVDDCDLLDVLEYIAYEVEPINRRERAMSADALPDLTPAQEAFVKYVSQAYVDKGINELELRSLPTHMQLKFGSVAEAVAELGGIDKARTTFRNFQKSLYLS